VACIRVGVGAAVNVGGQVTVGGGRCGLANNGQEPLGHGTGRVLDPGLSCGFCVESPAGIEPANPSFPFVLPRTCNRGRRGQAVRSVCG
jgi:hypothetical protein